MIILFYVSAIATNLMIGSLELLIKSIWDYREQNYKVIYFFTGLEELESKKFKEVELTN